MLPLSNPASMPCLQHSKHKSVPLVFERKAARYLPLAPPLLRERQVRVYVRMRQFREGSRRAFCCASASNLTSPETAPETGDLDLVCLVARHPSGTWPWRDLHEWHRLRKRLQTLKHGRHGRRQRQSRGLSFSQMFSAGSSTAGLLRYNDGQP